MQQRESSPLLLRGMRQVSARNNTLSGAGLESMGRDVGCAHAGWDGAHDDGAWVGHGQSTLAHTCFEVMVHRRGIHGGRYYR